MCLPISTKNKLIVAKPKEVLRRKSGFQNIIHLSIYFFTSAINFYTVTVFCYLCLNLQNRLILSQAQPLSPEQPLQLFHFIGLLKTSPLPSMWRTFSNGPKITFLGWVYLFQRNIQLNDASLTGNAPERIIFVVVGVVVVVGGGGGGGGGGGRGRRGWKLWIYIEIETTHPSILFSSPTPILRVHLWSSPKVIILQPPPVYENLEKYPHPCLFRPLLN